jgi:hypothetical protein
MSYIVQRQDRFYVVACDGLDPLTGRKRRRWHPVGHDRTEAEQLAERLDRERDAGIHPLRRLRLKADWTEDRRRRWSVPSDTIIEPSPTTKPMTLNS